MTHEEIEAMMPDEINCYLAERVMGWTEDAVRDNTGEYCGGWKTADGRFREECYWNPATDLNDAMEILPQVEGVFDVVVTDPPYSFGLASTADEGKAGSWADLMNTSRWYADHAGMSWERWMQKHPIAPKS